MNIVNGKLVFAMLASTAILAIAQPVSAEEHPCLPEEDWYIAPAGAESRGAAGLWLFTSDGQFRTGEAVMEYHGTWTPISCIGKGG